jgi:ribonuclease HI
VNNQPFTLHTDGGSRGNPGPAAIGYILFNADRSIVVEFGQTIGETTNNQAEYQAIVAGLKAAINLPVQGHLTCKLDSQLVVRQINGVYKMKNEELRPWLEQIKELIPQLPGGVEFIDIPREQNKEADALVNRALDGAT